MVASAYSYWAISLAPVLVLEEAGSLWATQAPNDNSQGPVELTQREEKSQP